MKMYTIYSRCMMNWFFSEELAKQKSQEWGVPYKTERDVNLVSVGFGSPYVHFHFEGSVYLGDCTTNSKGGDTKAFYCHVGNEEAGRAEYDQFVKDQQEKMKSYYSQPWV